MSKLNVSNPVPAALLIASLTVACSSASPSPSPQPVAERPYAGQPTRMSAYYDGELFTISFSELPSGGEVAVHDHSKSFNTIYQCDACKGQILGGDFVSVLDAIQGDGFNPIWEEQQITFNAGHAPVQFLSDNDVLAAAARGDITITDTDEMYICSVLGPKK